MKWYRVKAIIYRHWYNYRHSFDKLVDSFYWPTVDILLWGLTSMWIRENTNIPGLVVILLTGLVFWQFVWRGQYEFTVNLLEEMWNQNLVSLFASPLKIVEWVLAAIGLGLIKILFSIGFSVGLVWLLYAVKLWEGGFMVLPAAVVLLMSGWWIGLFVSGILIRFGTRIQTLAWSGIYLLSPFSAIYYPVSALPEWAQQVAWFIPMSHAFTYMRAALFDPASVKVTDLGLPLVQTIVLVLLASWWFGKSFEKSLEKGLARLE
jgi:ABC-2 type transport system permease protein